MSTYKEFKVSTTAELPGTPEQAWDAITGHPEGWLWPMEPYEPRLGGAGPFGSVITAWDPPRHFSNRVEGPDGFFNALDHVIEDGGDGAVLLRYVHHGVIEVDEWDTQYDGAVLHTDFYLNALANYIAHFSGRTASYVAADGSGATIAADSLSRALASFGVPGGAAAGDSVRVSLPGGQPLDAEVDFLTKDFLACAPPMRCTGSMPATRSAPRCRSRITCTARGWTSMR
jgi:hypothetical protein